MTVLARQLARSAFSLQEMLKRHGTGRVLRSMEETQWLSREAFADYRAARLRRFLCRIGDNVPYFSELFRNRGFAPAELTTIADLSLLPLMDKRLIREHRDALVSRTAPTLRECNTGGSSGEPLVFFLGAERVGHDVAAKRRATRWWGVDIGDREIVLWGSPIELGAQDRLRLLRDRLLRTRLLPAFSLSEQTLADYAAQLRRFRPRMLFGYPSALAELAAFAERRRIGLRDLGIRVVFVTSERLYEHQRQLMERVFACPVANGYGGRDAGFIAHECPDGGMHITGDDIVVEIIGDHGEPAAPGELGEIVTTHMATGDFPFVRYRTGDFGALSPRACPCGRVLPLLERIEGRSTDFLTAADGSRVHALALIYTLRELPGVEAFKIVQESQRVLNVQLTAGAGLDSTGERRIREEFAARLGPEVTVRICRVDQIAPEPSGKHRYVVNRCAPAVG